MKIEVATERGYQTWPSWFVVYEWEDIIADHLHCKISPLYRTGRIGRKIRRIKIYGNLASDKFPKYNKGKWKLAWVMSADSYKMFTRYGIIPIFLDFHSDMASTIAKATNDLPFYWVTSYHIYSLLKQMGSANVEYMPLSISDKYIQKTVPEKSIDVIQFGRKNPVLHQFMLDYCERNPQVEYVYATYNGSLVYTSTLRGELGRFDTRKEYMDLLSSCKVSLVSSPGIDKGPKNVRDFGSNDFITPRFFESAAMYSHMIGRYSDMEEAAILKINDVCCNVGTQKEFDIELNKALNTDCSENVKKYRQFLSENVTSARAEAIREVYSRHIRKC